MLQNGSLLKKCSYLSNESSYTVFPEDGVKIVFLENNSSSTEHPEHMEDLSYASESVQSESYGMQSFSFETQVYFCLMYFNFGLFPAFNFMFACCLFS